MTIQVWSSHETFNVIFIHHGKNPDWLVVEKEADMHSKISIVTEEKAKQVIEKNKLSRQS